MILLNKKVGYVHEPFNIGLRVKDNKLKLNYWLTYINIYVRTF